MKIVRILIVVSVLAVACGHLEDITPSPIKEQPQILMECKDVFPKGHWQFIHSIEARFPGGKNGLFLGVTDLSSSARIIQCALMTVEGFVLFSARCGDELVVERAVPPFDDRAFAEALVNDIRLIFLEPESASVEAGRQADGSCLCRYRTPEGELIDVGSRDNHGWQIRKFDRHTSLRRTVEAEVVGSTYCFSEVCFPERIVLSAHGMMGYVLSLDLVQALQITEPLI